MTLRGRKWEEHGHCKARERERDKEIERYLKQAIVDRNAFVASSALMSGLRLFVTCPEIVRRWINEVQEAGKNYFYL